MKRGLFATRAPHRPNQISLSAVEIVSVDVKAGRVAVRGLDVSWCPSLVHLQAAPASPTTCFQLPCFLCLRPTHSICPARSALASFVRAQLIDGTPVLDIKPYVAYCDAFASSRAGWIDELDGPADGPDRLNYWPPPRHLLPDDPAGADPARAAEDPAAAESDRPNVDQSAEAGS